MRLQLDAKDLRRIVGVAGLPVQRMSVPILQCVKLTAEGGWLTAAGSNLDTWCQARCDAAVADPGTCCVNFDDLRAISNRLTGVVRMGLAENGLTLIAEGATITLPVSGGEFPKVSAPQGEAEIEGGAEAMALCTPFAATEEVKWHLRGVTFDGDTATGTNGQRFYAMKSSGGTGQIVPSEAAQIIGKMGGRLFLSDKTWRVEAENMAAQGRLIDHSPLNWKSHIFEVEPFATLEADDLIGAIEMATAGRAAWVVFHGEAGGIAVSGDRFKGAHIESRCDVKCEGRPLSFVCETSIALTIFKAFEGRRIALSTANHLIKVTPTEGEDFAMLGALRDARSNLDMAA